MTAAAGGTRTQKSAEQAKRRSTEPPRRHRAREAKNESVRVFFHPRGMR
jgi:hypothetical protein